MRKKEKRKKKKEKRKKKKTKKTFMRKFRVKKGAKKLESWFRYIFFFTVDSKIWYLYRIKSF